MPPKDDLEVHGMCIQAIGICSAPQHYGTLEVGAGRMPCWGCKGSQVARQSPQHSHSRCKAWWTKMLEPHGIECESQEYLMPPRACLANAML